MRWPRLLLGVLLTLGQLVAAIPANADPITSCPGVLVVVEAQPGQASNGCATDAATGTDALRRAGFTISRASNGMLCRLGGLPSVCSVSATGYWSYWHAVSTGAEGYGPWEYSQVGADTFQPQAGDAEGWVYGDGSHAPSVRLPGQDDAGPGASPSTSGTTGPDAPASPRPAAPGGDTGTGSLVTLALLVLGAVTVAIIRRRQR